MPADIDCTDDFLSIAEGARLYLVPSLPVWGDQRAFRIGQSGQSGLGFRSFRLIIRDPKTPKIRLHDRFYLAEELMDLALPPALSDQRDQQLSALVSIPAQTAYNDVSSGQEKALTYSKPLIMGVLNVTPDSFSDGGEYSAPAAAIARARQMMAEGAHIIDIGGESTRPGSKPVWEGEEADRVVPVIQALASEGIPLSIDTRHSFVMGEAIKAGAHIINDVSALTYDSDSLAVAAATTAPIILMHSRGSAKDEPVYDDVLLDVYDYLAGRIKVCVEAGIDRHRLITDPGIGFGKRVVEDNIELLNSLSLFHTLGCPLLIGASRKRFIGAITGCEDAADRVTGSVTAALKAIEQGVQIVRVHDVKETKQAVAMAQTFHDYSLLNQPGLRADRKL